MRLCGESGIEWSLNLCQGSWGLGPFLGHWHGEQPQLLGEPLLKVPEGFQSVSWKRGKRRSLISHLPLSAVPNLSVSLVSRNIGPGWIDRQARGDN